MKRSILVVLLAVSLSGCGGGDKCARAIDKVMGFAREMMASMSGLAGADAARIKAEMEKKMDEGKAQALTECRKALTENPEPTHKALDCVLGAANMMDLARCEGADKFMKME